MAPTYPGTVTQYLIDACHDEALVKAAFPAVAPFFQIAADNAYRLRPGPEIDATEAHATVERLTDGAIAKIETVSFTEPFPKPDWMSLTAYARAFHAGLSGATTSNLSSILRETCEVDIRRRLTPASWANFGSFLHSNLMDQLFKTFGRSFGAMGELLWGGVARSLNCFFGFILLKDAAGIDRLTPLLCLLVKAIPLGEKRDQPGVWLILTA